MKRILAIGDIHGCRSSLEHLLEAVELTSDDFLITLGDHINRGPDSQGVLDLLISLAKSHPVISLQGNHESMLLGARRLPDDFDFFLNIGGFETMESYGTMSLEEIPQAHWRFLDSLKPYYETESHLFVHGNMVPGLDPDQQTSNTLFWEPLEPGQPAHKSGKTLICGHFAQRSGLPLALGHSFCIDTGAVYGGWLTCLDVDLGFYWQTNEAGDKRVGLLEMGLAASD